MFNKLISINDFVPNAVETTGKIDFNNPRSSKKQGRIKKSKILEKPRSGNTRIVQSVQPRQSNEGSSSTEAAGFIAAGGVDGGPGSGDDGRDGRSAEARCSTEVTRSLRQ